MKRILFYFVDKANIDDLSDAHAETGFCNAIRKARLHGNIFKCKFAPSYFFG
jgi:hypothetical protein